jgi:transcription elongation factor GreA-like protein
MTDDIQKAVEAGKLTAAAAAALAKLPPGTYVQHKSWGYGRIAKHDFLVGQTVIDFKNKKGHPMQIQYAAESLAPLNGDHIAARKFDDLDAVRALATSDIAGLVRVVLQSLGGRATQDQITAQLVPDVFAEPAFKKWWEKAKTALKADPLVGVPSKKSDPFLLRAEGPDSFPR